MTSTDQTIDIDYRPIDIEATITAFHTKTTTAFHTKTITAFHKK